MMLTRFSVALQFIASYKSSKHKSPPLVLATIMVKWGEKLDSEPKDQSSATKTTGELPH